MTSSMTNLSRALAQSLAARSPASTPARAFASARRTIAGAAVVTGLLVGCGEEGKPSQGGVSNTSGTGQFKLEAWADNWFSFYLGEDLVVEDSVPITTERSFNAETHYFDATYPMELSFILKDYKEDDSGLEYIGTDRQQMGDGGFIAQITDTQTGKVIAVTASDWKCVVIHKAPTNVSCESAADPISTCESEITSEPSGWKASGYDTSSWVAATEYTESAVSPKDGYDAVTWDASAKLIWTSSLETDNTLLCKFTITGP